MSDLDFPIRFNDGRGSRSFHALPTQKTPVRFDRPNEKGGQKVGDRC